MKDYFENGAIGCLAIMLVVAIVLFAFAIGFGVLCIEGFLLMIVWNAVVPVLWVSAPHLSFWLSVGILFIIQLVFGAIGRCFRGISNKE